MRRMVSAVVVWCWAAIGLVPAWGQQIDDGGRASSFGASNGVRPFESPVPPVDSAELRPTAEDTAAEADDDENEGRLNWKTPTLGGKQFWADELLFHEWRIQRHVYTGHCRLLDDRNHRRAWGGFGHCRQELERLKQTLELPPMKPRAVIVLHGIWGTRSRMDDLVDAMRADVDQEVLVVAYPSTRADLDAHAESLGRILKNLDGVREVSFVAHSLGNLVIRRYLATLKDAPADQRPVFELKRVVMLGPPNHGAQLATRFRENSLFRTTWGPAGVLLATDWTEVEPDLALPPCPFGIIAGGCGDDAGYNPLLPGDDDFVVRVEETRLPGAADFLVVPVLHSSMMGNESVQQATIRFLQHGYFVSEEARRPIPVEL
ncbi:MAG: hypothetical protein R3C99_17125 [Pirellulaceae bacterium]